MRRVHGRNDVALTRGGLMMYAKPLQQCRTASSEVSRGHSTNDACGNTNVREGPNVSRAVSLQLHTSPLPAEYVPTGKDGSLTHIVRAGSPEDVRGVQRRDRADKESPYTPKDPPTLKATADKVDMNTTNNIMEKITARENMILAYKRVRENKGAAGIDGITLDNFPKHLKTHWPNMLEQLRQGRYKPQPVRCVPIPKPDGGTRELGIPTLTDRLIQQAILQVLTPLFDPTFSESSYGFRPGRSAHQAVRKARDYLNEGYPIVVDIDLEKFFDTVNHDRLMARLAKTIEDKRLLKLIRRYLQSGILHQGMRVRTTVGTPQGGPLSPLLANIVLDELDRELEKRGHHFCRYADDCNIYVKTLRAGERVMKSVSSFIEKKLRLKVNQGKSAVDKPSRRKFLSFSFYRSKEGASICIAAKAKERLKRKVRVLTSRMQNNLPLKDRIDRINQYLKGWIGYFALAQAKRFLADTDATLKRRLRMCIWKQWKRTRTRYRNLRTLGMNHTDAIKYANTRKGYWRIAGSMILTTTLTNQHFKELGLLSLVETYQTLRSRSRTAGYGSVRPVV